MVSTSSLGLSLAIIVSGNDLKLMHTKSHEHENYGFDMAAIIWDGDVHKSCCLRSRPIYPNVVCQFTLFDIALYWLYQALLTIAN